MTANAVYQRVKAACCPDHGLATDEELESHIRAIVRLVLAVKAAA